MTFKGYWGFFNPGKKVMKGSKAIVIIYYYSIGMSGTSDFDDSKSIGSTSSTSSVSNSLAACPYCPTTISFKFMFNHVFKQHYKELVRNTTPAILEDMVTNKKAFKVQNVQGQCIVGCLSCLKTFSTESRATSHINKDGGCLQEHVAHINKMLKANGMVLTKDEHNAIWFKTLCHFLPHIDCYIAKVIKSFGCNTDLFDNSVLVLKDVLDKIKTADRVSTNWCVQFNRIVGKAELIKNRYDPNSLGFMVTVKRCKWLPDEKQLDEIMIESDIEYAMQYKLKAINVEPEATDETILAVADFLQAVQNTIEE